MTCYRKTRVQECADEVNRLHKVLEGANVKLVAVATDILGVSGRRTLEALLGRETDPDVLADLARGRLRGKLPELRRALKGRVKPYHLILITRILAHIDFLEASLHQLQEEVDQAQDPFAEAVALLQTIPGVGAVAATALVAEIGVDMSRFPSAKHLASWAGVYPGNKQSGGKRLAGKATHGNPWLRAVLGEATWAAALSKDTYFNAQFKRIARRRGRLKAVDAVTPSILTATYVMLCDHTPYKDRGADYFDKLDAARIERHHVARLERLGYTVTLSPKNAA